MQGGFFEEQLLPIPWDSPSPAGEASGAAGMIVPVSPEISVDPCVGISSSSRGGDMEELLIHIPVPPRMLP